MPDKAEASDQDMSQFVADRRRIRWFGWRQCSIFTPRIGRWSAYIVVRFLPRKGGTIGVAWGRDEADDEPVVRFGIGLVDVEIERLSHA